MVRFKIGDRVRNIKISDGNNHCLNKIGKIIYINMGYYVVEFFEDIRGHDGHDGNKPGKNGYCWNLFEDEIEFFTPILKIFLKEKEKFKKIVKK